MLTLSDFEVTAEAQARAFAQAAVDAGADAEQLRRWFPGGACNPSSGVLAWSALSAISGVLFCLACAADRERRGVYEGGLLDEQRLMEAVDRNLRQAGYTP